MHIWSKLIFTTVCIGAFAAPALADDPVRAAGEDDTSRTAPPTPVEQLPPPMSSRDPAPPVAKPDIVLPPRGLISQAGVGGKVAYGRPGVLELGGSAGLVIAPRFRNVNVSPSFGWFIANNFEVSAILSTSNIKAGKAEATVFCGLLESSYHLPFNRTMFGFMGWGMGGAYTSKLGGGFALAPRIGANFLVGRSGILTPSLSYEYTTHSMERKQGDHVALLAVSSALRVNIGYTAMW